ncbi:MAG TPA: hypothetical protein VKU94_02770 [Geobacterales bacterium]|nr:hypothetical protein [Geobacterales bacterium]
MVRLFNRSISLQAFALIVVVIIAALSITGYYQFRFSSTQLSGAVASNNPYNIVINAITKGGFSQFGNYTHVFHATVLSVMPGSLNSGFHEILNLNQTNNPYGVILFQNVSSTNTIRGKVSPKIIDIYNEWKEVLSPITREVSLILYADYDIYTSDKLFVYQYYDNIPIAVNAMPKFFNVSVYFDLNRPVAIFSLHNSKSVTPSLICGYVPNCSVVTKIVNQTTVTGPLPIVMGAINDTSKSELLYYFGSLQGTLQLSFTSVSATSTVKGSYSGTIVSSHASWSGTDYNFSYIGAPGSSIPDNYDDISLIYIGGVSYYAVETETDYYAKQGSCCVYLGSTYSTSISIINVSNNNFSLYTDSLRNLSNSPFWYSIISSMGLHELVHIILEPAQTANSINYQQYDQGYTSAASAEAQIMNAVSVFVSSLGLGFSLAELLGLLPGAGTVADAIKIAEALLSAVGLDLSIISAFSSISYSTTSSLTFNVISAANKPYYGKESILEVFFYQAEYPSSMIINGTTFNFNFPSVFLYATPIS